MNYYLATSCKTKITCILIQSTKPINSFNSNSINNLLSIKIGYYLPTVCVYQILILKLEYITYCIKNNN